jgi:hypothetical protein
MGADTFMNVAKGHSAQAAFDTAVSDARYECGHGGYTGTIAEKGGFVMIRPPFTQNSDAERNEVVKLYRDYADKLIEDADPRIDDKWGPAGCIDLGEGEYLFFGWASS